MTSAVDVLLVEDSETRGPRLETALRRALRPAFHLERLSLEGEAKADKTYEDQLAAQLQSRRYAKLALIVTDRDLSRADRYPGLSEAVISRVAARLHIPVCVYASGKEDSVLEVLRSGGEGRIILSSKDLVVMSRKVRVLADGFQALHCRVDEILSLKAKAQKYGGPASVLAELLEAPEVVDHLTLYARGDQRMISELMPMRRARAHVDSRALESRRIALALGLWLYNSILRFPGVVVSSVAAASFLGIDVNQFAEEDVRGVFKRALYGGPFSDPADPRWWRHKLLELIANAKARNGRELAEKVTGRKIRPCLCGVNRRPPAGFMCVITETPVCESHSVAQVSWLPRGADLARVRKSVFEDIGPWIGLS
jgi:hypothetical protein